MLSATATATRAPDRPTRRSWSDFATTVGVWLLYAPHYTTLRLLTPRYGFAWARFVARLHWLLTFFGAQAAARENIARLRPFFDTDASVATILRRHLEIKHEAFARVRVYHLHGPDSERRQLRWEPTPESEAALASTREAGGGLIVVGFHDHLFECTAPLMRQIFPGRSCMQVKLRRSHNVEHTNAAVAEMATQRAIEADRDAGASVFYVDDHTSMRPLIRVLREGGAIAVAADGAYGDGFVDTPFFDGRLRASQGWARLAAISGARVLIVVESPARGTTRRLELHDHVQCRDASPEAVRGAVAGAARVLQDAISRRPWGWHPWQRLRTEQSPDGTPLYALGGRRALAPSKRPVMTPSGPERKPVAVLCNSVTPYRLHLHRRLVDEVPEAELWTLSTHGNAYSRWADTKAPDEIRPVEFGAGEPTNEQTDARYSLREWRKAGRVIRWLRDNQVKAVFCQGCGDVGRLRVLRWCRDNGVPAFLTGDFNVRGAQVAAWKRPVKDWVYRNAVRWSTALMPCGSLGMELLDEYGGQGKPRYPFPFCPDTAMYREPPAAAMQRVRERYGLDPSRRRVVFSARMMPVKRPDIAIEAFARIAARRPEWDLVMVGDGPLREPTEAAVPPAIADRVLWTGFLNDPADVAAICRQSDVLALPSDHEPWGVVIVEAAAAELAIVTTDVVGAAPELVREGRNGATFPPGDAAAMADALLRVTDPARIDSFRRESPRVLAEWLDVADPVANFRAALTDFGVIRPRATPSPAEAGPAVATAECV